MTNEEAIKMLKSKLDGHTDTSWEWTETVRMAINALEQTDGDLISKFRDYQIEWLTSHNDIDLHETEMWVVQFLKDTAECFVKTELPSAEKTTINSTKTTITDGDLISRTDLLNKIFQQEEGRNYDGNNMLNLPYVDLIKNMPTITAEPKTGLWIPIDDFPHEVWECDHCGFVIDGSGCIEPTEYRDMYNFCPNCGKKMWK